jgi:hypothetical protein
VDKNYQEYRHLAAKAKIARSIFLSVRDEPELDQLFDANRCFEIVLQRVQIADAYWTTSGHRLVKRSPLRRFTIWPLRIATLAIIRTAGFFTDWGRSPSKSVWFLLGAMLAFSAVYRFGFEEGMGSAVMRALNCTFVFGYTRYAAGPSYSQIWCMPMKSSGGLVGLFDLFSIDESDAFDHLRQVLEAA